MTDSLRSRRGIAWTALSGLLVVALVAAVVWLGRDEYRELARRADEAIGSGTVADEKIGPRRLRLPEAERRMAGIATAPLASARAEPSAPVQGTVADPRPLVEARGRYLAQAAQVRALKPALAAAEADYQRALALFRDDRNVAERTVQAAEAQARAAREQLAAAEAVLRAQADSLRAEFGPVLAEMAINPASAALAALLDGREVLVTLAVPAELEPAVARRPVSVEPAGGGARRPARLLSAAPAAAGALAGASYWFRTGAAGLRAGMRVVGHVSTGGAPRQGVVVPATAVVWHAGRSWVYVAAAQADEFERLPVTLGEAAPGGWFATGGLEAGQQAVVTGVQLLLSEELEYQIRNENED
jgi:hypothetical protein